LGCGTATTVLPGFAYCCSSCDIAVLWVCPAIGESGVNTEDDLLNIFKAFIRVFIASAYISMDTWQWLFSKMRRAIAIGIYDAG